MECEPGNIHRLQTNGAMACAEPYQVTAVPLARAFKGHRNSGIAQRLRVADSCQHVVLTGSAQSKARSKRTHGRESQGFKLSRSLERNAIKFQQVPGADRAGPEQRSPLQLRYESRFLRSRPAVPV